MKTFKKVITLLLVVALTAAISIGGTVAYLSDSDAQVNTFTNGNVYIDLWEDFGDNDGIEHLMPAVGSAQDGTLKNGIEKEVYVTNTGTEPAYVRVHIAIPTLLDDGAETFDASANILHFNYTKESIGEGKWDWSNTSGAPYEGEWNFSKFSIDGVDYNVYTVTYEKALVPGESTVDAMSQVYLDSDVTNEDIEKLNAALGEEWKIYVCAEATQAAGFENAYEALNTAFGGLPTEDVWKEVTGATFVESATVLEKTASSAEEVKELLANGNETVIIDLSKFENNTYSESLIIPANGIAKVVGDGTLATDTYGFETNGDTTFDNVTVEAGNATNYANIHKNGSTTVYDNTIINSAGGGIGATDGAKVTFNSGSVDVSSTSTSGRYNFYAAGEGSEITINGGEFSFSKTLNQKRAYVYASAGTTVYINGGTFGAASSRSGYTAGILGEGTVIITGGTFGFDPSNWVAEGYEAVKDGTTWTVSAVPQA